MMMKNASAVKDQRSTNYFQKRNDLHILVYSDDTLTEVVLGD